MVNRIFSCYLIVSIAFLFSCSPDNPPNSTNTGGVVIKYEIKLPGPIIPPTYPEYNLITYTNETAQQATLNNSFISGSTWSKTITLTETRRPLTIGFMGIFPYSFCNTIGPIISNIYINNVLKATLTAQPISGNNSTTTGTLNYILQ